MSESKTSENRLRAAERQRQALGLRKGGAGYAAIATALGYRSVSGAYDAVHSALRATLQAPADEVRLLELERLDALLLGLWQLATKGDGPAVDRCLRIMERRASLLGLDAPIQVDLRPALELYARKLSTEYGLDEAEALAEVATVLRESRR